MELDFLPEELEGCCCVSPYFLLFLEFVDLGTDWIYVIASTASRCPNPATLALCLIFLLFYTCHVLCIKAGKQDGFIENRYPGLDSEQRKTLLFFWNKYIEMLGDDTFLPCFFLLNELCACVSEGGTMGVAGIK